MGMVARFRCEGFCPVGSRGRHFGFVREVGEEKGKIVIVADITEPSFVARIRESVGEGKIEIEADRVEPPA